MRTIHNFVQGSPEWHEHRRKCNNASDAPTVLNENPYESRREFLKRKVTGVEKEFDQATLARFAKGHELEAQARVWAEEIIGEELYPVTMSDTIDGMLMSASFDGLNMLETIAFEHKTLNKDLEASLKNGAIPSNYYWQMEQGLMISGAEKCLFMASNGTRESMLYAWYYPSTDVRKRLLAGWAQFWDDVVNYEHEHIADKPVAAAIDALPALMVQVEGKVLATNLDAFVSAAKTFIGGIKTELVNDQDFVDADKMTKFLKDGEDRLGLVKSQALAQTQSIEHLFRTIDDISAEMRAKRLTLEKLVKSEKESRRLELIRKAQDAYTAHVDKLNERIGGWMPRTVPQFAEAIKGLKSLDSMHSKLDGAVATAKLEANEIADVIEANRNLLEGEAHNYMFLFPDFASVCTKSIEDFSNLLAVRIRENNENYAKQVAQELNDQRGNAGQSQYGHDDGVSTVPSASTPPIHVGSNADIVDDYLQLLAMSASEKKALKVHLEKFVKYWQAKMNMEVSA